MVDVQEQFYEIGTCREMATEWIGEVKVLMSQQEGVMWFGGKSRVGQGRLPGRCQDSQPWGLGFGGGLASIGQLEKVREGFWFWTRSQVQARDMRTRTR